MAKELAPMVIHCVVWGPTLRGNMFYFNVTIINSLVSCISKGYSKDPSVMHLLRCLWFFVAFFDIKLNLYIFAEDIARVTNCVADMLSRNNVINFFLLHPQAHCLPTPLPAPLLNITTPNEPDWTSHAFSSLFSSIIHMYGASPSTWNTYSAGQQWYLTFCAKAHRKALPTSESALMLFVSHLADTGLAHSPIKVYLSSVHHLHVTQGQHSQFSKQLTPCLQQVLKGINPLRPTGHLSGS